MTNATKRFLLAAAMVCGMVLGPLGSARASTNTALHGPFTWRASMWPNPLFTGYNAASSYCWLTGFDVGSAQRSTITDQVYVFMSPQGDWAISGANGQNSNSTTPSSHTWATAYCIDLHSTPTKSVFFPWGSGYQSLACPGTTDSLFGGSCYTRTNGTITKNAPFTWTSDNGRPNAAFKDYYWTNAFASIQGIGYTGKTAGNNYQFTVNTPGQQAPYMFQEQPVATWIQNKQDDASGQIAYGGFWPIDNRNWFCDVGVAGQTCSDPVTFVSATASGQAVTKNVATTNYVCALKYVNTSGADGEISAKLEIVSGAWQLTVVGPSKQGSYTTAEAACFPAPYSLNP